MPTAGGRDGVEFRFGSVADGDLAVESVGVEARREAICPLPWSWLHQVHGADVVIVDSPGGGAGRRGDALVTTVDGACLSVQTADCAPVIFTSDNGVIGAAHAGWRGLYDGVLEATLAAMAELGATGVTASLGPCISADQYEFGAADLTTLALRFGPEVVAATASGRPAFDLRAGVRSVLRSRGVALDEAAVRCTAADPAYYSWRSRRDTGRQASAVWMRSGGA